MNITQFYTAILGSNLHNPRWSWGSYDPINNRVYLRVWKDEIREIGGSKAILVLRHDLQRQSHGYPERQKHLTLIQGGSEGYGVLCTAVDPLTSEARKIREFDSSKLLRLRQVLSHHEDLYAQIAGDIFVSNLQGNQTAYSTLTSDIKSLQNRKITSTEREALINARVGQGQFRSDVLRLWKNRCAVTGSSVLDIVRASHIKAWKFATSEEKLDPYNGLPLIANLDALFDAGLITFGTDGSLLVSSLVSAKEKKLLGLANLQVRDPFSEKSQKYLEFHRCQIFRK